AMEGVVFDLYKFIGTDINCALSNAPATPACTESENWVRIRRTRTDEHGMFWFTDLQPGMVYEVRENLGLTDTNDDEVDDDEQGLTSSTATTWRTPSPLQSRQEYVFADGAHIMWDVNNNNQTDPGEIELAQTLQAYKTPINVGAELEFGNYVPGSIHGAKFEDVNGNGQWDEGEPAMEGIQFELLDENGDVIDTATSNSDGEFWFTNLTPGTYTVRELDLNADHNGD